MRPSNLQHVGNVSTFCGTAAAAAHRLVYYAGRQNDRFVTGRQSIYEGFCHEFVIRFEGYYCLVISSRLTGVQLMV